MRDDAEGEEADEDEERFESHLDKFKRSASSVVEDDADNCTVVCKFSDMRDINDDVLMPESMVGLVDLRIDKSLNST
jgi:hypothetical protein